MKTKSLLLALSWLATATLAFASGPARERGKFTVAMIPDTQNYIDYTHQKAAGFPFDAVEQYYEQMNWIATNARSNGGEIVFATHVGDLWQHYSEWMDPAHEARGFKWMPNLHGSTVARSPKVQTRAFEIPAVVLGFRLLKGRLPFSVVPGNHDYDALWTDPAHPPRKDDSGKKTDGVRHVGGLSGYQSVFSGESEFFKGQSWYVGSHDGGGDSAQVFSAGGRQWLHLGLQYHAPDASLQWAAGIVKQFPGLPTIVSTHDYLARDGKRNLKSNPLNSVLDPQDNDPQMMWDEFISQHDQIFLVLCGHVGGQSFSVDRNRFGHDVYQMMADYQGRGQSAKDAGVDADVGDGWLRLLNFDLNAPVPRIDVRTYSTLYKKFASELKEYAAWYKTHDGQSKLSDADYLKREEFTIELKDFRQRFGGNSN
ncbi:serine/threonine protein phosphatase [Oleiharenicola lentus]|uniref:serine/threonine protein phosphatase n=1 Tax=Oleiharenicola lentus TaxID=2508720 RepID=UPI003F677434